MMSMLKVLAVVDFEMDMVLMGDGWGAGGKWIWRWK